MKSDMGRVQLKCQQNSIMHVLNRPLVTLDYSLGEILFLPGRFRSHLPSGGIWSCTSECVCHGERRSREKVAGGKRFHHFQWLSEKIISDIEIEEWSKK